MAGVPGGGTRCSPRARRRAAVGVARGLRVAARALRPGATSISRSRRTCRCCPGVPLLLGVVALGAWRLWRLGRVPPRVIALLAGILTFWVATAVQRGIASPPGTSRYLYVGSLFLVLLAVELARGTSVRPRAAAVLGVIALAGVAANIPLLRQPAPHCAPTATTRGSPSASWRWPATTPALVSRGHPPRLPPGRDHRRLSTSRRCGSGAPSRLRPRGARRLDPEEHAHRGPRARSPRQGCGAAGAVAPGDGRATNRRRGLGGLPGQARGRLRADRSEGDAPPAAVFVDFTVPASGLLVRATEGDARSACAGSGHRSSKSPSPT